MRVGEATILGLGAGVVMNLAPYPLLIANISAILLLLAVASILLKKKILTGPVGGFLLGLATGIGLGLLIFKSRQ